MNKTIEKTLTVLLHLFYLLLVVVVCFFIDMRAKCDADSCNLMPIWVLCINLVFFIFVMLASIILRRYNLKLFYILSAIPIVYAYIILLSPSAFGEEIWGIIALLGGAALLFPVIFNFTGINRKSIIVLTGLLAVFLVIFGVFISEILSSLIVLIILANIPLLGIMKLISGSLKKQA